MTTEHEASRTLVKSPPELWAECSEAGSLARHLSGSFGSIRITRLEPETTVAWEGEHASGTVRIEPSGWGTRVTLTAQTASAVDQRPVEAGQPPAPPSQPPEKEADVEHSLEEPEVVAQEDEVVAVDVAASSGNKPTRPRRRLGLIARLRAYFAPQVEVTPGEEAGRAVPPEEGRPEPVAAREELPPEPVAAREELPPEPVAAREELPPEPVAAQEESQAGPEPVPKPTIDADAVLTAALVSLGQAHHRPFSRA